MKLIYRLLFLVFTTMLICLQVEGQKLYWVNGEGSWNDKNHWSTESGGTGGAVLPNINDEVIIDKNSFPRGDNGKITIDHFASCKYIVSTEKTEISGEGRLLMAYQTESNKINFSKKLDIDVVANGTKTPFTITMSSTAVQCHDSCNGTASAVITGGTAPFTILWYDGVGIPVPGSAGLLTISGLCPDTYSIVVEDADGDVVSESAVVANPPALIIVQYSQIDPVCNGICDGQAKINLVVGGVPPRTYNWSPNGYTGDGTNTYSDLCDGTYVVTITDSKGCTASHTFTLTEPTVVTSNMVETTPTCNGDCDATATVNAGGGTPPYDYLWDDPAAQTTDPATGLCSGTYNVIITDDNGCILTDQATITDPPVLVVTIPTSTDAVCGGDCDGTATTNVVGGIPPYTYLWSNGETTPNATALCGPAWATVTVTDANGCEKTATVFIDAPISAVTATITGQTNLLCFGVCNGSATVAGAGGNGAPWTYDWSPNGYTGDGTDTYSSLCAGTYNVTVEDAMGCSSTTSVTITQPATAVTASIPVHTDVLCAGECTGSATAAGAGGTPPYTYLWNTIPAQNTPTATGLCDGTYTVTVYDFNLCTATASITITEPAVPLTASITGQINVLCFGQCTGQATAAAAGGTAPYTILWDDPAPAQTTWTATGLCAGTYTPTVTDANGCTVTTSVTITEPATAVTSSITAQTNVLCFGLCNGTATVTPVGGTPGYTYLWCNGQTTPNATGLCAGNCTVTVTDSNGCTTSSTVTITQPATAVTASITAQTNVTCFGLCDGTATVTPVGGTPPYTVVAWSDPSGQTTFTAVGLCAGTYSVTVTDDNGCLAYASVTITQPATAVSVSITDQDNVLCFGECTGTATAAGSGGTGPYDYLWDNGQTTALATGLCAGIEGVTVTDDNGCTASTTVTITEPATAVSASITSQTNVLCFGQCTGSATIAGAGGTPPYTYGWPVSAGGVTTPTASNLCAGTYTPTVTDANGCTTTINVIITEPATAVSASITAQTNVVCTGTCSGSATVAGAGGTPGYIYAWPASAGGVNTPDAINLCAGSYIVTVTDANGCTTTITVTITEPAVAMTATITGQINVACPGECTGEATADGVNGTPLYTYFWSDPANQTTQTATGLCDGVYTVTVTDALGCSASTSVTITEPPTGVSVSITDQVNVLCFDECTGTATATGAGGNIPYTYLWDDPAAQITPVATGLCDGVYTVVITDAGLCTASVSVTITEPATAVSASITDQDDVLCFGECTGSATIAGAGGTPGYTYQWDDGQITPVAINLCDGTYNPTVTDNNGCTVSIPVVITEPATAVDAAITAQTNIICTGTCTGEATVSGVDGTPPYTYQWPAAAGGVLTPTASNLCVGTYTVTVYDANLCDTTIDVTITEPPVGLSAIITNQINVACMGDCTGEATADGADGLAPYTFAWDDPLSQITQTATGLCAGTYNVVVTDANLCTATTSVIITEPATGLTASITDQDNVLCQGECTGTATVTGVGGTIPYTYLWDDPIPQVTQTATALCDGTYTVTVTDAVFCTATATAIITEPALPLGLTMTGTDVLCFGGSSGTITTTVTGGTPVYSYVWSPATGVWDGVDTYSGLAAGTYDVTVTDANGCTITGSYTVNEPLAAITITLTPTNALCNNSDDGSIFTVVAGGTVPYSYAWLPATGTWNGTDTYSDLAPGTYTVTVTDANGCIETENATITEPNALVINPTITDSHCTLSDGAVTVTVLGGTPGYTYDWSPDCCTGEGTNTYSDLPAGNYTVTVTDANGCTIESTSSVTDQDAGTVNIINVVQNECFDQAMGEAFADMVGGTAPFTFIWTDGQTTQLATGLTAGIHCVTVTDTPGCVATACITITEPDSIEMTAVVTPVTCFGGNDGEIDLTVIGGTSPYTFAWTGGYVTEDIINLTAQWYTVTVTDDNGCTNTDNFEVTEPPTAVSVSFVVTDLLCNGDNTGDIDMTVTDGIPPYTYNWSTVPVTATEDLTDVAAGTYDVTVTDNNGCSVTGSATINEPTALSLTETITNSHCLMSDGQIAVVVAGGTPGYSYIWNPGGYPGDLTDTYTSLPAGTYNLTVTYANGCTISDVYSVSDELPGTISFINIINNDCFNDLNGSLTVQVTGADPIATYDWAPDGYTGDGTDTYSGLPAGTYSVIITDVNGCIYSGNNDITEPDSIEIVFAITDVLCSGDCSGELDITVTGGTSPYSYDWSNLATTEDITALCANNYIVTITDNLGCTNTDDADITEPTTPISLLPAITNVTCNSGTDGSIDLTVVGGTGPYTFEWNTVPAQLTEDVVGLAAGFYDVTVTDDNGCTVTATYEITEPTAITVTETISPSHCLIADGSIVISVSGGTPGYSYVWDPATGTWDGIDTYSALSAGAYNLTVTDAVGCERIDAFVVTDEDAGTISFIDVQNEPCFGDALGEATVVVIGGAGGNTYEWSTIPAQLTETATNLSAGTYFVSATDANGCLAVGSIDITEPVELTISLVGTDIVCHSECTGEIDMTISGGTPAYDIVWSTVPVSTDEDLTGLCTGTYFVTVEDNNGCQVTDNLSIFEPPTGISATFITTDILCHGATDGTVDMTPAGGIAPYTFEWLPGGQVTEDLTSLAAGTYYITITDASLCTYRDSVTITEPDTLEVTGVVTGSSCGNADGSVVVTVTGGVPGYTYTWDPLTGNWDGIDTYSDLSFGNYILTVTDANSCTATYIASVSDIDAGTLDFDSLPATCFGFCDGEATMTVTGGTPPFTYLWGDTQNTQTATGLCAGIILGTVTDNIGCGLVGTIEVTEPDSIQFDFTINNITCVGEVDGNIHVENTGGTPAYSWVWDDGTPGQDLTGLSAGFYGVTVTDANGCTNSDQAEILEPTMPLVLTISGTPTNCFGDSTGTVTVVATGGVPDYSYVWSTSPTDTLDVLSNVPIGTYTVTVTDDYGCTAVESYTVTQPDSLYATFTDTVQVNCDGLCIGSATITPAGGTPPYTYIWEDGQTDSIAIDLCAGITWVTVIDNNLCEYATWIEITDTSDLELTITDTINPQCAGDCNGQVIISVTGGTTPYIINWSTLDVDVDTISNLCPGIYSVTISDANTCSRESFVELFDPDTLYFNFTDSLIPLCSDSCNGALTAVATGGVEPYSYEWSTGATDTIVTGLCPGFVSVTVTDNNGCQDTLDYALNGPDPLDPTFLIDTAQCSNHTFDAAIDLEVTGGTGPYSYLWSNDSTTQDIDNLEAGVYYVTIIDVNGCQIIDSAATGAGIVVDALALQDTVLCYGDSIQIFGYGGDSLYWAPALGLSDSLIFDPWAHPLETTTYYFTTWDSTGTCYDVDSVVITVRPQINITVSATDTVILHDFTTELFAEGGGDTITFLWYYTDSVEYPGVIDDPYSDNPTVTPEVTTTFYLISTSPDGCTELDTITITVIPEIIFPTGITPNGDDLNDTWEIDNIGLFEKVHISIYNRWGEKLFEYIGSGDGYEVKANQWDGTFNGKDLPIGTYYFTIDFYGELGTKPATGPLTIVR